MTRLLKSERPRSSANDTLPFTHSSSASRGGGGGGGGGGGVKHALSLPDLTTPLLDPASWVEVPPFAFASPTQPSLANPRGASSIGRTMQIQMQSRRPFSPQLTITPIGIAGAAPGRGGHGGGDFRTSASSWSWSNGEQSMASHRQSVVSTLARRRGRKKAGLEGLNVLVAGGKGAGKTSFINLLATSLAQPETLRTQSSPQSPTSTEPSLGWATCSRATQPTTRPNARTIMSNLSEPLQVRLIDTPGIQLDQYDEVKAKERERGVLGLLRIIEDRYEDRLREEGKVRRGIGAEDQLVHLVIYLIDAREILLPSAGGEPAQVDWSCVGLFDDDNDLANVDFTPPNENNGLVGPTLSIVDIDILRQLARRANVLPVLSHSDALTIAELAIVREAVGRDLRKTFGDELGSDCGLCGIGYEAEDTDDAIEEESAAANNIVKGEPGHSSASSNPNIDTNQQPYAIFAPDGSAADHTGQSSFVRRYPWGDASVLSPQHCDFARLRGEILVHRPDGFRTRTRQVLYEQYRTERLLARRQTRL